MSTSRTPARTAQTTIALVALAVTALLAPAASAIASPTREQMPRLGHGLTIEAVLPSDPREPPLVKKGGEPS
ncbi:MAG: hypothetical protein QOK19_976 [Solirubrobacteraceae bacterium]|jgi:hypothetical protein|nr:hypothetical protein [Solirubrobacteraceae bacterium]